MTVGELIDAVRDSYLRQFQAAVAEQLRVAGRVLTEVALRDGSGAPVGEGLLQLPMRLDIVPMQGGQPGATVSVDSESRMGFKTVEFLWGRQLRVSLSSFCWDNLRADLSVAEWKPLQQWFLKWFSAADDGDGEPLGVVHFLSDPKPAPVGHSLTVDLGTAPVQAFEELLDAVEASGARTIVIGAGPAAACDRS